MRAAFEGFTNLSCANVTNYYKSNAGDCSECVQNTYNITNFTICTGCTKSFSVEIVEKLSNPNNYSANHPVN